MPLIAFAALAAAHLFDFVSFIVMTGRHGLAAELNPIVVALAEGYGLPGLTVAKIAAVLLLGSVFLVHRSAAGSPPQ